MPELSYPQLRDAVAGDAVGARARVELEPLGGPGDKLFPPTYGVSRGAETKYAVETRRVDGRQVPAVVLDSVASQANRMELALLQAHRDGELALPMVAVDFAGQGLIGLDRLTHLETSHRVFDAALRDSLLDGVLFRMSDPGRAITEATPRNAGALFHYSPSTLLFGGWDSTGPRGGLGAKYERAITSEVVATGVELGKKTSSRIDALGIERKAGTLYATDDPGRTRPQWTLDPAEARKANGKPVAFSGASDEAAGRPSHVNHGNVTPSINTDSGGVTAEAVHALVVVSFAALRKLRFPASGDGAALPVEDRRPAAVAAWTALAALGLAATVLSVEEGFDLRSRCVLAPRGTLTFELLHRDGTRTAEITVSRDNALALVDESRRAAAEAGLTWNEDEVVLRPTPALVDLIRRSQDVTKREPVTEEGAGDGDVA